MIYPFLISIVFLNSAFVHGAKYVETVDVTDSKGKSFSCKYVISYTVSGGPNVGNSKAECSPNKDGGSVELMLSIANYGDVRVKHFVRKNKDNIKSIVKVDIDDTTTTTTTPETTPTPMVPTELVIGSQQPFTASEMASMDPKPTLYMRDENGDTVHQVGSSSDPWIVTASIASGPGALANNVTCAFEQGLCVFGDLAIDTEGGDYSLSFELTHPTDLDTPIPAVVSYPFDVETRILSSEFTHLDILVPVNQTFNATVSVWDTALDMEADVMRVPANITCSLALMGVEGVELLGTLDVTVTGSQATWTDLQVSETISSAYLGANCAAADSTEFVSYTLSDMFNVHPYPKTGRMREATADFTYSGPLDNVDDVLSAFAATLVASQ